MNGSRSRAEAHVVPSGRQKKRADGSRKRNAGVLDARGRISVMKRRHGLNRCRRRGEDGQNRLFYDGK